MLSERFKDLPINRKINYFATASLLTAVLALSGCGPNGADAGGGQSLQSSGGPIRCENSYPGASVLGMVGGNPNTPVTVDRGNDGTIDYRGAAVNAGGLQYNAGAQALGSDGRPGDYLGEPFLDRVCWW